MKKIYSLIVLVVALLVTSCSGNMLAEMNRSREADTARLQSEYAKVVSKLEMQEGNFTNLRRVVLYNVRLNETVAVIEGHCHVQIDKDGDVEVVVKDINGHYYRHYLGRQPDCTYYSIQLEPTEDVDANKFKIYWNPSLWLPSFTTDKNLN